MIIEMLALSGILYVGLKALEDYDQNKSLPDPGSKSVIGDRLSDEIKAACNQRHQPEDERLQPTGSICRFQPLFSVRETLFTEGEPDSVFEQCLIDAKRFIDANSVSDILHYAFEREESRRVVRESVHSFLHVGFLSPHRDLANMEGLSKRAGFLSGFTVTSAVVSRELGYIEGCANIPTAIFIAKLGKIDEDSGYVEVFVPNAEGPRVRKWMDNEVGTHIGLILEKSSALTEIEAAFRREDFQVAPFMEGKKFDTPGKEASIIYYEKPSCIRGKFRIEILSPCSTSSSFRLNFPNCMRSRAGVWEW
uniref:Uncharacterized protein n=1 Tax=Candidatus Kentrum eta TaxID=2126337 RepID=A0A450V2E5_9GAMM|nr:MAG: hypothetical protein BECKH772A_GA0070896_100295 [Candidatus Kentron sp. H]VFJ92337.1 MAG: hypothetical protein BECKH772B_GA0070898_100288 [Candidatus Kentron sp. H]VFJ98939.1 MAG: hypothetical protein BECKH772C_GA0070978_100275 [Candidatus Kentron sp. H]